MIYVLFSVLCSVSVAVCIKMARSRQINIIQMIAWNYPMAIVLSLLFFLPDWSLFKWSEMPFSLYLVLGLLLPSMFYIIAQSLHYAGIVRTEVAQRLSLFIPLAASFLLFREHPQPSIIVGIIVGIMAMACSIKWKGESTNKAKSNTWFLLPLVFLGMGTVDILFKQVAQYQQVPYTLSILIVFVIAALLSQTYVGIGIAQKKMPISKKSIGWGFMMGLFNFGNIIFYMKAHRAVANNPSIVFSSMNIGVIAVGAVVGLVLFREKLSFVNVLGIILAVVSVLIITLF
ncbi:EamA family transporter [Olivibacter sitiensis]|uniref:EamA family transporter n=1 Tax=Olivibacter sitiensis TaxID=376470 RepID=UPI0004875C5C|nr:EamA family transporter [Olivibacter sitiensis]